MSSERDNIFQPIIPADYNIAGNAFRAYYDADKKLVFVVDSVITDIKPNVLLVINPVGDRKWDDILLNDYGVDLETVRPKQFNKYQKLDIEYTGLSVYDELIQAYNNNQDLTDYVQKLMAFRQMAAMHAAQERLDAANQNANRARETIDRTKTLIYDLQVRVKDLRAKATKQRRDIGKEPTKKSAAKILRTEAQIEATNDKLARAKKRLTKAQRRLTIAEDDAEIAQAILDKLENGSMMPPAPSENNATFTESENLTMMTPMTQNITFTDTTNNDIIPHTEVQEMADNNEDVKPLFDTDPEIIDEEIAFKPIDFGATSDMVNQPAEQPVPDTNNVAPVDTPLSFAPPTDLSGNNSYSSYDDAPRDVDGQTENEAQPVSDVFTPVPVVEENISKSEYETLTGWGNDDNTGNEYGNSYSNDAVTPQYDAPVASESAGFTETTYTAPTQFDDVTPANPGYGTPESEIGVAPVDSEMRPVSPITGGAAAEPATDYVLENSDVGVPVEKKKTSFLYYFLLLVLIALSVFTLWLYQQSVNGNLPELGAKTDVADVDVSVQEPMPLPEPIAVPVIEPVPVVVEPVVEPEPIVVPDPAPVVVPEPEPEPEPVVEIPEPEPVSVIKSLRYVEEDEEPIVLETEEEILAKKPAYGVSQNENMFVAAPEYETENIEQEVIETCADGQLPDSDGCCTGEFLTVLDDGAYACCVDGTDECFPPMF